MKKIFSYVLLSMLLIACSQSQEQKAETLIKESLKKTLYKPDTYKSVETKVDSAFSPYDDPALYEEMAKLGKFTSDYQQLEEKAKDAKSKMALWDNPYQTEYERYAYEEAKEEYDEVNAQFEKLKTKGRKIYDKVVSMLQEDRKFIGYKAVHNYRADNNLGNTLIGNSVFFIDENFTKVLYSLKEEEYDLIQESIKNFIEEIEELTEQKTEETEEQATDDAEY